MGWSHTFGSLSGSIPLSYLDDNFNDAAQLTQLQAAAGFRNLIINGNFAVNQRVYTSGTATTVANQYTLDRWYVETSGDSVTFAASGNGNEITIGSGVNFGQIVAGENILGGTYTLSWSGTATAKVNGTACTNGGQVTLTANTNAKIVFTNGTLSQVQLEPGGMQTDFEQRPEKMELRLAQDYFRRISAYNFSGIVSGFIYSDTQFRGVLRFAEMRATPTVAFGSAANFTAQAASYLTVCSALSSGGESPSSVYVLATISNATSGQGAALIGSSAVTATIDLDAEIVPS